MKSKLSIIYNLQQVPIIPADQPRYPTSLVVLARNPWRRQLYYYDGRPAYRDESPEVAGRLLSAGEWLDGSSGGSKLYNIGPCRFNNARWATHQVTAAALYILQNREYQRYLPQKPDVDSAVSFGEWCDRQCAEYPQFKYWELTLQLALMVLQFV